MLSITSSLDAPSRAEVLLARLSSGPRTPRDALRASRPRTPPKHAPRSPRARRAALAGAFAARVRLPAGSGLGCWHPRFGVRGRDLTRARPSSHPSTPQDGYLRALPPRERRAHVSLHRQEGALKGRRSPSTAPPRPCARLTTRRSPCTSPSAPPRPPPPRRCPRASSTPRTSSRRPPTWTSATISTCTRTTSSPRRKNTQRRLLCARDAGRREETPGRRGRRRRASRRGEGTTRANPERNARGGEGRGRVGRARE